ncbi:SDR family NAD(P)-dependent oxidoreductase [Streptococcus sp. DD13]|uniref:SDR family NAD(P)-dependent oxidoreductase n=1 Tax=Streptococcus sp. DD13 TaxID=1777881 RepID=UPI000799DDD9|nr:SDR family oxidoreductase [Streptococcus sp. DD13]KXT79126.1 Short chain dehydrogenase [Streptococcus sp. DD13]
MKTILITGASGGIAQAIVQRFPEDHLILIGRNLKKLEDLYGKRPRTSLFEVDICDESAVQSFLDQVALHHGPIDILINNAGYGVYRDFDRFSSEDVRQMFEVNVFASMRFCRLLGARMKERKKGHIINIVSMSGHVSTAKSSVYSASKFAMIGFTDAIRLELAASGVKVTSINPGPVKTAFFDLADPDGSYQKSVQTFLLTAEQVAKRVQKVTVKPKREVNMPWTLALTATCYRLFPRLSDFLARTVFNYK